MVSCHLDPINQKREHVQSVIIPNITVVLYQNKFINEITRTMKKGEPACPFRGHNSAKNIWKTMRYLYAHAQCMSELCSKFQTPASNTVRVAETQIILQCDIVKRCMSFNKT